MQKVRGSSPLRSTEQAYPINRHPNSGWRFSRYYAKKLYAVFCPVEDVPAMPYSRYQPVEIETKWQERWANAHAFAARDDDPRPKYYNLVMFPYPSGDLHIGHWYNYTGGDAYGRIMRMRGFNVMQPIGFDAFGLPAENAAIKRDIQPRTWTLDNIANMQRQLRRLGAAWDWS